MNFVSVHIGMTPFLNIMLIKRLISNQVKQLPFGKQLSSLLIKDPKRAATKLVYQFLEHIKLSFNFKNHKEYDN